jgi:hypothetical protein
MLPGKAEKRRQGRGSKMFGNEDTYHDLGEDKDHKASKAHHDYHRITLDQTDDIETGFWVFVHEFTRRSQDERVSEDGSRVHGRM